MSILEQSSQQEWDLPSHRISIPESSRPNPASTSDSSVREGAQDAQGGFFYISNFITEDEERYLTDCILGAPKPKWKTLQNRRLQEWGGQVSSKNTLMPQPMPEFFSKYPDLISRLRSTGVFDHSAHGEPNHCLVNEYLPGQGIMAHEDGPAYFPAVATISLGSHTLLDIYRYVDQDLQQEFDERMERFDKDSSNTQALRPEDAQGKSRIVPKERIEGNVKIVRGARAREPDPIFSILQEPRSLLVTTGQVYKDYLHGIAERTVDGSTELAKVVNIDLIQDPVLRQSILQAKAAAGSAEKSTTTQTTTNGIDRNAEGLTRESRLSFTFRDVEKVSKGVGAMMAFLQGAGSGAKR